MQIHLKGMDDAQKQMARIERATKAMARYSTYIGSYRPYAYGIEHGHHRVSGKVARKAGGARYITAARDEVLNKADADLSEGLNKVTAPGRWIFKRLGLWTRRVARVNVPRKSGKLRRSIRSEVRG